MADAASFLLVRLDGIGDATAAGLALGRRPPFGDAGALAGGEKGAGVLF